MIDALLDAPLRWLNEPMTALLISVVVLVLIALVILLPWRHWLFIAAHRSTRCFMRWARGACQEQSYGQQRPCVLWRGHASPHRSVVESRWLQADRWKANP